MPALDGSTESTPTGSITNVQYMLRAFLTGGPNILSVFDFELAGPPATDSP